MRHFQQTRHFYRSRNQFRSFLKFWQFCQPGVSARWCPGSCWRREVLDHWVGPPLFGRGHSGVAPASVRSRDQPRPLWKFLPREDPRLDDLRRPGPGRHRLLSGRFRGTHGVRGRRSVLPAGRDQLGLRLRLPRQVWSLRQGALRDEMAQRRNGQKLRTVQHAWLLVGCVEFQLWDE